MAREREDLTPPYGYLVRLFRPFPDFDPPFIKPVRQKAVELLHLKAGDRVLDVGCGPGGSFPYLVHAVGQSGQVVGVEISPEISINANRRIAKNGWTNVEVIEAAAEDVHLTGLFDALLRFAAPDVYLRRGFGEYRSASTGEHAGCCIRSETFQQRIGKEPEPSLADALQPLFLNNSESRLRTVARLGEAC
jgi:SAM-dependent methyltransferase